MNTQDKTGMRLAFLNLRHHPARLTPEEAGWLLGFSADEIAVLGINGLLKPLGKPGPLARKWYAHVVVAAAGVDAAWMTKATETVAVHWRAKNLAAPSRKTKAPTLTCA
jgi:hypothetical protein